MDLKNLLIRAQRDDTPDEVLEERIQMGSNTIQHRTTEAYERILCSQQKRAEALQKERALEKVIEECSAFDEKDFN